MLNIIVTCTKKKSVCPDAQTCLYDVPGDDVRTLVPAWIKRLKGYKGQRIRAIDLYQGDHWQVAKSLVGIANPFGKSRLWVCSAGYGLIPADCLIAPYSATFSSGHPDSVPDRLKNGPRDLVQWWRAVSKWSGPDPKEPRTIAEIALQFPKSRILVAASNSYLQTMLEDLEIARNTLVKENHLVLFSGTGKVPKELSENLVDSDARMQGFFGGALMSLNVRTLGWAIENSKDTELSPELIRKAISKKISKLTPRERINRTPLTDVEVGEFIERQHQRGHPLVATSLLNLLRSTGFACEQKRFRKLLLQTREAINGKSYQNY